VGLTKDEIIQDVKDLLFELRKKYDIKEAYLFGSYAQGSPKEYSDVDVAIVLGSMGDGSPFGEPFEIFHEVQQHNSLFEAVCFQQEEFSSGDTLLVRHIKREGIKIL
jgi:predicted nucleotidyltransferase